MFTSVVLGLLRNGPRWFLCRLIFWSVQLRFPGIRVIYRKCHRRARPRGIRVTLYIPLHSRTRPSRMSHIHAQTRPKTLPARLPGNMTISTGIQVVQCVLRAGRQEAREIGGALHRADGETRRRPVHLHPTRARNPPRDAS
jgi:hypothetical protein